MLPKERHLRQSSGAGRAEEKGAGSRRDCRCVHNPPAVPKRPVQCLHQVRRRLKRSVGPGHSSTISVLNMPLSVLVHSRRFCLVEVELLVIQLQPTRLTGCRSRQCGRSPTSDTWPWAVLLFIMSLCVCRLHLLMRRGSRPDSADLCDRIESVGLVPVLSPDSETADFHLLSLRGCNTEGSGRIWFGHSFGPKRFGITRHEAGQEGK